ncbi:hypothetical protein TRFO_12111 [Tritrichomonas foetus]|uniref:Uncharacterized protein n=1 Tax=Tritrichomonas foetus TaxID=1144522 RepID=A0A1J4J6M7_9EUKA|nr:hypothetical protein TRFO_12111 [Tritrichomonas foetus]|eukprot:OHS93085.1 hypothetical protein TRFO_12111 [Tritrichomonas foetus]
MSTDFLKGFNFNPTSTSTSKGKDDQSSSKSSTSNQAKPLSFNFGNSNGSLSTGLSFDTSKKSTSSSKSTTSFGFGGASSSLLANGSEYQNFLQSKIATGSGLLSGSAASSTAAKPINLNSKKDSTFEVRRIQLDGIHFENIFIYKNEQDLDDGEIGPSFDQVCHLDSKALDEVLN